MFLVKCFRKLKPSCQFVTKKGSKNWIGELSQPCALMFALSEEVVLVCLCFITKLPKGEFVRYLYLSI
jgi:hypothetical protein